MTDQQPITPPDELVMEWINKHYGCRVHRDLGGVERTIATQSACWGYEQGRVTNEAELQKARDEELDACCALADERLQDGTSLRAARRPKPPSLKEQALAALEKWAKDEFGPGAVFHKGLEVGLIRRAIQALPD